MQHRTEEEENELLRQHTFPVVVDGEVLYLLADVQSFGPQNDDADAHHIDPEIDEMDASTPEADAFQCVLRSVAEDPNAPAHERVTAHYLSLWIGTNDIDIMDLDSVRPWLVKVVAGFVQKYPLTSNNCSSVTLQEAYDSVIYKFEGIATDGIERLSWTLLKYHDWIV